MTGPDPATVLDLVPAALAEVAADGRLQPRNAAMSALLGELGGIARLADLPLDPGDGERLLRGEGVQLATAADPPRMLRLSLVSARDGRWLMAVDETVERELRMQIDATARARALAGLAGEIVHDLNNHLVAATGFADQVLDRAPPDERASLSRLLAGMHRGGALLRALAVMLRAGPRRRQVVSMERLVRDVVALLGKSQHRSAIELVCAPDAPGVRVRPDQAMQAVLTVLLRARASAPAGGPIRLDVVGIRQPAAPGVPARHFGCLQIRDGGDPAALATPAADADVEDGLQLARLWLLRQGGTLRAGSEDGARLIEVRLPAVRS
jgi:hypothetical protein